MNKALRNLLAAFGLAENQKQVDLQYWYRAELRKLEDDEEIEPPWIAFPYSEPWGWNQGYQEEWKTNVWRPFWEKLNDEDKREYLEKWEPSEVWYVHLVSADMLAHPKGQLAWHKEQRDKLLNGEEIEPPWRIFPLSLSSFGWDEGLLERWKLEVWIPFWDRLGLEERQIYIGKWPPPNDEWEENIISRWVGQIKKTEEWLGKQKSYLENPDTYSSKEIQRPWEVFPTIDAVETAWSDEFVSRWLDNIWVPFWNNLDGERQDEYLSRAQPPGDDWLQILSKHKIRNLQKLYQLK